MFYFGPVKGLTLVLDVGAPQGHYWHIYHSQAVPVTVKEPVVPYLRLIHCCADGKRQITSLFIGLPFPPSFLWD